MYLGFVVSLLLHAAVLGWALLSFHLTKELPLPETPVIEAQLVTLSELTRLKQGDPDAKVLESKAQDKPNPDKQVKEAPKPKMAALPPPAAAEPPPPEPPKAAEPPPPPKPEPPKADPIAEKLKEPPPPPTPEPTPGPTPDEQKKLEEKLEQDRKAEEQKKAEEKRKADEQKKLEEQRKKAEELKKKKEQEKKLAEARKKAEDAKKKQFDANKLSVLLNKIPDASGAPAAASTPPSKPTQHTGPSAGEREGKDTVLTAREADLLKGMISGRLKDCWRLPGGGGGVETPVVRLRWNLRPDGSLEGQPHIEGGQSGPSFQIAAEAAIRAVQQCAPFQLPADKYSAWKQIIWDFDPTKML